MSNGATKGESTLGYTRYGIYHLPAPGALAAFGARWLGWDVEKGCEVAQPDVPGIAEITMAPRKYGFHATLKPPFRLSERETVSALRNAAAALANRLSPVDVGSLEVTDLAGFLALVPRGETAALRNLAEQCVQDLDSFRAPPSAAELAKRRAAGLSASQEANLLRWGYPYVFEDFRFHMTLTNQLSNHDREIALAALARLLPPVPRPYVVDQIALVGERPDGRFEMIERYRL